MTQTDQKPLTKRQQQIYDFIVEFLSANNAPPTRIEIANYFGFKSANAAEDHLKAIAKKGHIELKSGTSRGILIPNPNHQTTQQDNSGLAVVGDVAAGEPILAQQHIQQYVNVKPYMFNESADFLLKVKGDSMQNIGIYEQDLLAIKKTETAYNNQIVVARIGDEVTVKRFFKHANNVSLVAENEDYSPIEVDLSNQDFAIEGVVVGLIRQHI